MEVSVSVSVWLWVAMALTAGPVDPRRRWTLRPEGAKACPYHFARIPVAGAGAVWLIQLINT